MPKNGIGYADEANFEVDRGIPRGLVMRDMVRRNNPTASLADFGTVPEPFPEWYQAGFAASSVSLPAPAGAVVKIDLITTTGQAQSYARAGHREASKTSGAMIKDAAAFQKALKEYRFVNDTVDWASGMGVTAQQNTRLVDHLKKHLRGADVAFNTAVGKTAPMAAKPRSDFAISKPGANVEPLAPIPAPVWDTKKIVMAAGVGLLGLVLFFTLVSD